VRLDGNPIPAFSLWFSRRNMLLPTPLPALADEILRHHRAAATADTIADVCVGVSIAKRIAAGEALAEAWELLGPERVSDWLTEIGISHREAHQIRAV
jgi:hypothetical protein